MATNDLYESPAVCLPTQDELTKLSDELNLKCTTEELEAITGHFKGTAKALQRISQLPEPALPVKYPRTPGYRPAREDNPYNAWAWKCDIQGAKEGKLAGKTVGIKDNIGVAGVPMMNGSKLLESYTPEFDATLVTRILDAGGRIVGKAACEDLCFSGCSSTCSSGPVRNPYDETRSVGGSSSGSAALVAGKVIDLAVGGDQGGSIRIPACWAGIVGLKPTYGLVPYTGAMPIEITVDHLGPMARTVHDCALLLEVMAGYDDGRDPRQPRDIKVEPYSSLIDAGIKGKKIGLVKEGFSVCTEEDVKEMVRAAAKSLEKAGAIVSDTSVPAHLDGNAIWSGTCLQGAYNNMIAGNGNGYHWKGHYITSLQESFYRSRKARPFDMSTACKLTTLIGEYMNRNYSNKFYAKSQNLTRWLTDEYNKALEEFDVLIMPTLPYKARKLPKADCSTAELIEISDSMSANTAPFDCTGHPALSIDTGNSDTAPIGMMIIGKYFNEVTVLQIARAFEKIREDE
ncbi:hypothetical protein LOTGIDRAFT_225908 [Lottia gigantea]|uniref:Amidase domain-containing protein n=1 Tax=Lottia gigantea TaxID=225164 RepID=V4CEA9_LOTGI|nr:hypothetical protein LOTGIDRAFT_225908 [Lottia gigantea]ESP00305.1 hypothetical protein LOTGIDRAFT_225908 [Lottia gigantea]